MLLSPGKSPVTSQLLHPPLVSTSTPDFATRKRRRGPAVLDDDTYVAAVEKIIERNFFPDIPKLRDRLEWLQAVRSRDPALIRYAQLKILERRRVLKGEGPAAEASRQSTAETPDGKENPVSDEISGSGDGEEANVDVSLQLDDFCRKYTSEDSESFLKIVEKVNRKRKEKYGYLLESVPTEWTENGNKREICATDGYGTSNQPSKERSLRLKWLTKEIRRSNTRFHAKEMDANKSIDEDNVAVLYPPIGWATPVQISSRDTDKFYVESVKKVDNGYSFVKTPSPVPGVDESPFITWGEIEGTPLRLEAEDTPTDIGGPQFKIPMPPSRDVKTHSLSRDAAKKQREKSKMFKKPPLPSPVRGGSASPGARKLSSTARKFMKDAIANSSHSIDESLRASYRSSSPGLGTPNSGRSMSRLGRDVVILDSRSPSVREGSV
ncbi:hypothetical protein ABFS83_12G106400 [Erythranthe nasuta]